MADRTIRTVLELNASRFTAGAAAAATSARGLAQEMARLEGSQAKMSGSYDKAANTLMGLGGAAIAGLGLATKAAMDWESAWAGVTKTVDGTPEQMAALEGELRGLAKTLPATHTEIAAVAEAAGQLGVQRENVAAFTKTMIDLGETTNLSADEAATAIAQFSNVMHVSAGDVDNLGAALVDLGNKGASTEKDILMMAQRLSSTGALIGASSQDILGLSSALADVGISAEAGGGSISRVLQKMNTAVLDGGESLAGFAQVAGVSAEEFAAKWQGSPIQAFQMFEAGLQGVTDSGGNAVNTLRNLGIKSSEETRSVLSLASNYKGLAASLDTSNSAWQRNTALVAEAAKRYETTESKVKIAGNRLRDAAIGIGASMLPVLATAAEGIGSLADAFGKLPQPAKALIGQLTLIGGAAALTTGGVMKLVPAVANTIQAFRSLQQTSPGVASGLMKVGKAAGGVGLAMAALTIADQIVLPFVSDGKVTELEDYAAALAHIADGSTVAGIQQLNAAFTDYDWFSGLDVNGLREAYQIMADPSIGQNIDNITSRITTLGQRGSSDMEFVNREWEKFDQTLAGMADNGNMEDLQRTLSAVSKETGVSVDKLLESMPKTQAAIDNLAASTGPAVDGTGQLADASARGADAAEDEAGALMKVAEAADKATGVMLGARDSQRGFEEAIDSAAEATKKYGHNLDIGTEKGRENQQSLDQIASATTGLIDAQSKAGATTDELAKTMSRGRQAFIDAAKAKGMDGAAAEALADDMGLLVSKYEKVPEKKETKLSAVTDEDAVDSWQDQIGLTPEQVITNIEANAAPAVMSANEAKAAIDSIPAYKAAVVDGDFSQFDTKVDNASLALTALEMTKAEPFVGLDDDQFIGSMAAATQRLDEIATMEPTPQLNAEKKLLEAAVTEGQDRIDGMHGTDVDVSAQTYGYDNVAALDDKMRALKPSTDVFIRAEASGAIEPAKAAAAAIAQIPAVKMVIANADTSALNTKVDGASLRLAYLEAQEATPTADLDDASLIQAASAATQRLAEIDRMKPTPRLMAEKSVLERVVAGAKQRIDSMPHSHNTDVLAKTHGFDSVAALRNVVNSVHDRTVTVRAIAVGAGAVANLARAAAGRAYGGFLPGKAAGGWVPGHYPGAGIDNVLWPTTLPGAAGGRMLTQPLQGTEYVVASKPARQFAPLLEWINAGGRAPSSTTTPATSRGGLSLTQHINGADPVAVAREATIETRHLLRDEAITMAGG